MHTPLFTVSVLLRIHGAGYTDAKINDEDSTDEMTVISVLPRLAVLLYSDHANVRTTLDGGHLQVGKSTPFMDDVLNELRAVEHPRYGVPTPFGAERAKEIREKALAMTKYGSWYEHAHEVMTPGELAYVIVVWDRSPSGASTWASTFNSILRGEV